MYAIFAITRFTLLEALHNRLVWLFLLLLLIGIMLAEFMGGISITESLVVKTSLLSASLRIFAVFVISLFVITSMVREINDKGLALTLSFPVSRASYYFGKFLGYSFIAFMMVLLIGFCLIFYAPALQVFIWISSLFCELLIMTALCLLCVFTFTQVTTAITAVAAFYVLARSLHAIQLMSQGPLIDPNSLVQTYSIKVLNIIAHFLPDLHRFSPSSWLVYAETSVDQIIPIILQTVIYVSVLTMAGLFDLYRKNL